MEFNIDTQTIRRLRDALIESGRLQGAKSTADEHPPERMQAAIKRVSPFVATMYLVMVADGHADASEKDAILGALNMLTHEFLDEDALASILSDAEKEVELRGVEGHLQIIGSQLGANRQDREIAFTLAAAVAMADSNLHAQENELIGRIAEWYGISNKRMEAILQRL